MLHALSTSRPGPLGTALVAVLRDASWLTVDRGRAYGRVLVCLFSLLALAWIGVSEGGVDSQGKAIGTDFNGFWSASKMLLDGQLHGAYDVTQQMRAQAATFGRDVGYVPYFYPPVFLLVCWPLALLPYGWSLLLWLGTTGAAYVKVVRGFSGEKLGLWAVIAFPAFWVNAGHGQNGFLSAALLGGGALLLPTRPLLAGVCFGSLVYKPHLALAIPVALLAARRWSTIVAAGGTALAYAALSYAVFGPETWTAFFQLAATTRMVLEQGLANDAKVQSMFAAVRLLGGGVSLAYGLQLAIGTAACAALILLQRRAFRNAAEGPALVAASLLMSPYLFDYDLTLLAIPLAWCAQQGLREGFLPYEKTLLAAAFVLPLVSRAIAISLGVPLAPFVLVAVLALVLRRGLQPQGLGLSLRAQQSGAVPA